MWESVPFQNQVTNITNFMIYMIPALCCAHTSWNWFSCTYMYMYMYMLCTTFKVKILFHNTLVLLVHIHFVKLCLKPPKHTSVKKCKCINKMEVQDEQTNYCCSWRLQRLIINGVVTPRIISDFQQEGETVTKTFVEKNAIINSFVWWQMLCVSNIPIDCD